MSGERGIRESELAELIGIAMQLQERAEEPGEQRLSKGDLFQIGENLGISQPVMENALSSYRELRRDLFRSALGEQVREELLRKLGDVKLRDLYRGREKMVARIEARERHLRLLRKEMGLLELWNPFSTSPERSELHRQKEALKNERRRLREVGRRLEERVEEVLDMVGPLSVVLRTARVEKLLKGLGAARFSPAGQTIEEAILHQRAMRRTMLDAFGPIPEGEELARMVLTALPSVYAEQEDFLEGELDG